MINGFIRVAAAVPPVNVADVTANVDNIIRMATELDSRGVELAVMTEMCITGYTCGDLLESHTLLESARSGLEMIV
ncbi:MAG: NAD(+) synthase, partial [Paramuribaculum sp.]|nr:NAD(+) synthase [Paramuribaculum sp.]